MPVSCECDMLPRIHRLLPVVVMTGWGSVDQDDATLMVLAADLG